MQTNVDGRATVEVDGLVWDLDGIVRHWEDNELAIDERHLGLPPGAVLEVGFGDPLGDQLVTGVLTFEEWHAVTTEILVDRYGDPVLPMMQRWKGHRGRIDWEMREIVAQTTAQVPTALLSNGSTRLEEDLEVFAVTDTWTVIANTARIGIRKPDAGAYLAACAAIDVAPNRAAFIDDLIENVVAADRLGMRAHQHVDLPSTVEFLRTLGFLIDV
jgi:putative hydrolase of the HAD superfamily